MFSIVICLCCAASVLAAPAPTDVVPLEKQQPTVIPIVSQSDELEPNGTYHFSYETGNGIKRDEISYDKKVPKAQGRSASSNEGGEDDSDEIHVQIGSYSYTAPDGRLISVRYIADENGFQPIGDHIPRVPSASNSNSAEKSGRSLSISDSAASSSQTAAKVSKPAAPAHSSASDSKSAPSSISKNQEPSSSFSSEEPTKSAPNNDASPTEATSELNGSTAESGSTEASTNANTSGGSTTEATSTTTEASSTTTTEASSTTTEASSTTTDEPKTSTTTVEPSSTPIADISTNEASSTTPATA